MRSLKSDRIHLLYRVHAGTVTRYTMTKLERAMLYQSLIAHGYVREWHDGMGFYHLTVTEKGLNTLESRRDGTG